MSPSEDALAEKIATRINSGVAELLRLPPSEEIMSDLHHVAARGRARNTGRAIQVKTTYPGMPPTTTPGEALAEVLKRLPAANTPSGKQYYVLRQKADYPKSRQLDNSSGNLAKIAAVKAPEALTAAGLCAPLEAMYDVNVVGVDDRPIRDALVRFHATHGGIQYRRAIDASSFTAGTWTVADDEAVGAGAPEDDPVKTVQIIDCPDVETANVRAVYSILQIPNFLHRFDPDYAGAAIEAAGIAFARVAENALLADIFAGSTLVTEGPVLGATRDVLAALDRAVAYYRSRRRLSTRVPLVMIAPQWLREMISADIVKQQASADIDTAMRIADDIIQRWFTARGVRPVWHLDGRSAETVNGVTIPNQFFPAATAGQPLPAWPTKADIALFAEGDWLYLDGGTLDLGYVRDSALNRINRVQLFTEAFEGVAFTGVESLRLVLTLEPTGAAQAPIDVTAA